MQEIYHQVVSSYGAYLVQALDKPIDRSTSEEIIAFFQQVRSGKGVNPKALVYFEEKRQLAIPKSLLVWIAFLEGHSLDLEDEVTSENIGIGIASYFNRKIGSMSRYADVPNDLLIKTGLEKAIMKRPPKKLVLGFFDFKDQQVYLAETNEIASEGLFGPMFSMLMQLANGKYQELPAILQQAFQCDPSSISWNPLEEPKQFLKLPDEKRTLLMFLTLCTQLSPNVNKLKLVNCPRDVEVHIAMRKLAKKQ